MENRIEYFSLNIVLWYVLILTVQYIEILHVVIPILFLIGIVLTIFKRRVGFLYYLMLIILFDDYSFDHSQLVSFSSIDIYTISGQTLTKIWSLFWLVLLSFDFVAAKKYNYPKHAILILIQIMLFTSLLTSFIFSNYVYFNEVVNDLRFFVNFFIGYFGVKFYLATRDSWRKIIRVLVSALTAKAAFLIIIAIIYSFFGTVNTLASDTSFYIIPTTLIFISIRKKINLCYLMVMLILVVALLSSASRGKLLVLVSQAMLFSYLSGQLTRFLIYTPVFIPIAVIFVYSQPDLGKYLIWKLKSFSIDPSKGISTYTRYVELINIMSMNLDSSIKFIAGSGLGGNWTDDYLPYLIDLHGKDAYPDDWIDNNQYFKPHGNWLYMLLKFGVIGTASFFTSIYVTLRQLKSRFGIITIESRREDYLIGLAIITGIISLSIVAFSSKLQLFLGVFCGILTLIITSTNKQSSR